MSAARSPRMHDDEVPIDEALIAELLTEQFPQWAGLPLQIVTPWGTDNAIWRLGHELVLRFPRIGWASNQPGEEHEWLPTYADHLSVAVPTPVALGTPGCGYPFEWSVHGWLPGRGATLELIEDPISFASDLVTIIRDLATLPIDGGLPARNRARPLAEYDDDTRNGIAAAAHLIDADAALAVWQAGLAADPHDGPGTWVHGDLEGNCLVNNGKLSGLIDFGLVCVGDPAVDVQVAWSPLFTPESRDFFLGELGADDHTIARAKAAAINQACLALPYYQDTYPLIIERCHHKLAQLGVAVR